MKKLLTIVCILLVVFILVLIGKSFLNYKKAINEVEEIAELNGWDDYCYTIDETSVKGVYLVHIYNDENLYVYTIKGEDHWCVYWD